jgi:hypothetical protein
MNSVGAAVHDVQKTIGLDDGVTALKQLGLIPQD